MQTYLIDAFNLIHKIGGVDESPTPHEDLIRYLRPEKNPEATSGIKSSYPLQ